MVAVLPSLVGRDELLSELGPVLAEVAHGRPAVVLVSGDAGIGKTRLLDAALGRAPELVRLDGGCIDISDVTSRLPYSPFVEMLHTARRLPVAAPLVGAIDAWLHPSAQGAGDIDPVGERHHAFLDVIARMAAMRPVALVVEDVHWADASSLALLLQFARRLVSERIAVIVTCRSGEQDAPTTEVLDHLRRLHLAHEVTVLPLPDADVTEIVHDVSSAGVDVVDRVVDLADGNPLAAIEMARSVVGADALAVPRSVAKAVVARLGRAGDSGRLVLELLAVTGREAGHDVLTRVVADVHPEFDIDAAVVAAAATGLIGFVDGGYRFAHALDRTAVYDTVPPGARERHHAAVATALEFERRHGQLLPASTLDAEIAAHWRRAGRPVDAARAVLAAGRAAARMRAYPEALADLVEARERHARLRVTPADWERDEVEVALLCATCARWTGQVEVGIDVLEDVASRPLTPEDSVVVWERLGWLRREAGDAAGALAAYQTAIGHLTRADRAEVGSRRAELVVHAGYAALLLTRFRLAEARAEAELVLDRCAEMPSPERASALITLGVVLALTEEPERGLAMLTTARDVALACDSEEAEWRYVGNATFVLQNVGRTRDAVDIARASLERARSRGLQRSPAVLPTLCNAVSAMVLLGDWDEAIDIAEGALRDGPPRSQAAALHLALGEIYGLRGEDATAGEHLRLTRVHAHAAGRLELVAQAQRVAADTAAWRGDWVAALTAVDDGLAMASAEDPEGLLHLAVIGLLVAADAPGRPAERSARVDELFEIARAAHERAAGTRLAGIDALWVMANASLERLHGKDVIGNWHAAVELWETAEWSYYVGVCRLREAEAAIAARRRPDAVEPLRAAAAIGARLAAAPLVAAVDAAARAARIALAPAPGAGATADDRHGLTRREHDVLGAVAEGLTNRQVARRLGISERTVGVHVSNLLAKLHASSRTEAVAIAHRQGILNPGVSFPPR